MTKSPEVAPSSSTASESPEATPLERKPLQTFALHVCFLTLLFWVLPSLDAVYAFGFKAMGNAAFGEMGSDLRVEYSWLPPGERDSPGEIEMVGRVVGIERLAWESRYSVRDRGYEPSAVLLALMLATPMSRRRRIAGSVAGLAILNAFIVGQTGLLAVASFAAASADLVPAGEWLGSSVDVVKQITRQPIPRYAAVFATWALLAAPARGLELGSVSQGLRKFFAGSSPGPKT